MGHPYREDVNPRGSIPPLPVLLPMVVVATLTVLHPTAPWLFERGHPFRMLLAPLLGLPMALLLSVQAVIWNFLRGWWVGSKADADAAFATVFAPPAPVAIPAPIGEPATVLVEWIAGRRRGPKAWFDVDRSSVVMVPAGYHQVFIKIDRTVSDIVEVDLASGEVVHLVCGMKPLIRNRFFRFFALKLKYIGAPAAVAACFVPSVSRFIERHFQVEFLAIIFLGFLGFYVSLPRAYYRRPGAMIYLAERPDPPRGRLMARRSVGPAGRRPPLLGAIDGPGSSSPSLSAGLDVERLWTD